VNFASVDRDVEPLQDVGGDHGVEIVGGGPGMQVDYLEKGTTHTASLEPAPYFSYLRSANYLVILVQNCHGIRNNSAPEAQGDLGVEG
jgi:hypothetical protein